MPITSGTVAVFLASGAGALLAASGWLLALCKLLGLLLAVQAVSMSAAMVRVCMSPPEQFRC